MFFPINTCLNSHPHFIGSSHNSNFHLLLMHNSQRFKTKIAFMMCKNFHDNYAKSSACLIQFSFFNMNLKWGSVKEELPGKVSSLIWSKRQQWYVRYFANWKSLINFARRKFVVDFFCIPSYLQNLVSIWCHILLKFLLSFA